MKLRDYETDWLRRIRRSPARRVLIVGPTGSGKTIVAAALMRHAIAGGQRVLFVVHRRELVKQAVQRLRDSGVAVRNVGVILGGARAVAERDILRARPNASIQVASIQTLARRNDALGASLVLIDEAHHAPAPSYRALLADYPLATVYGLTATPYRLDGAPLGDLFDDIVCSAPPSALVAARWLLKPRVYTVPKDQRADLTDVPVIAGDFARGALARAVNRKQLVGNIVEHHARHAQGRAAVCYAVSVEHGRNIVEAFQAHGVVADLLTGTTPTAGRVAMLERLVSGATAVIVNCMVLTEGWDCPEAKVAIVARPTMSTGLWNQMCGRITRPTAGEATPTPLVLDHAGNAHVHGLPLDDVAYSLDGCERARRAPKPGSTPEKLCGECGCALPIGARVCSNCGYAFSAKEIVETQGRLVLAKHADLGFARCVWPACPTPLRPVESHGPTPKRQQRMHMACRHVAVLARPPNKNRPCAYSACETPDVPVAFGAQSGMHARCRLRALGKRQKYELRPCAYELCKRGDLVRVRCHGRGSGRTRESLHKECRQARTAARYRCQYEHCPTPDVPLKRLRSKMHRKCVVAFARAHTQGEPKAPQRRDNKTCDVCGKTMRGKCLSCAMRAAWKRDGYRKRNLRARSATCESKRRRCDRCGKALLPNRDSSVRFHLECWQALKRQRQAARGAPTVTEILKAQVPRETKPDHFTPLGH